LPASVDTRSAYGLDPAGTDGGKQCPGRRPTLFGRTYERDVRGLEIFDCRSMHNAAFPITKNTYLTRYPETW